MKCRTPGTQPQGLQQPLSKSACPGPCALLDPQCGLPSQAFKFTTLWPKVINVLRVKLCGFCGQTNKCCSQEDLGGSQTEPLLLLGTYIETSGVYVPPQCPSHHLWEWQAGAGALGRGRPGNTSRKRNLTWTQGAMQWDRIEMVSEQRLVDSIPEKRETTFRESGERVSWGVGDEAGSTRGFYRHMDHWECREKTVPVICFCKKLPQNIPALQ